MESLDLNLLVALDALLETGSVNGAAERLHTSAPAMSRTLARLRRQFDDPLLVRAGRGLVPTPRADQLRPQVRALVERAATLLTSAPDADPAALHRTFALQANDMLLAGLAPALLDAVRTRAPGVRLNFAPESLEGTQALRGGVVDLEVGVVEHADPETIVEPLLTGRLCAAVRPGHPLARGAVTPRRFAAAAHIGVSRRGRFRGPIDDRLADLGLSRQVVAVLPNYTAALFLARAHDLVCLTPAVLGEASARALGLRTIEIPLDLPTVTVSMAWHPRNDADPGHRWLRARVRDALTALGDP